jgi:hypothetical protein
VHGLKAVIEWITIFVTCGSFRAVSLAGDIALFVCIQKLFSKKFFVS